MSRASIHICCKVFFVLVLCRSGTDNVDRTLAEAVTNGECKNDAVFGVLVDDDGTVICTRQGDKVVCVCHLIRESGVPDKSILGKPSRIQIECEITLVPSVPVRKKGLLGQQLREYLKLHQKLSEIVRNPHIHLVEVQLRSERPGNLSDGSGTRKHLYSVRIRMKGTEKTSRKRQHSSEQAKTTKNYLLA